MTDNGRGNLSSVMPKHGLPVGGGPHGGRGVPEHELQRADVAGGHQVAAHARGVAPLPQSPWSRYTELLLLFALTLKGRQ